MKLDRFGWSGLSQAMKDRLTADWVDVLGAYDVREVKRAIADCLSSKPKMPTEHEVKAKVEAYRADAVRRAVPDVSPEPEQPRDYSPEALAARRALSAELLGNSAKRIPRSHGEAVAQRNASV